MFGNPSLPSRIYSYGTREPVEGLDLVREQMRLAHRYQNNLVQQERARRVRVDEALAKIDPAIAVARSTSLAAEAAVEVEFDALKKTNARAGTRVDVDDTTRTRIDALKDARAAAWNALSKARKLAFKREEWKPVQDEINMWDGAERRRLCAEAIASGLYWCNYSVAEQAMMRCRSGPPPQFHRWDGHGRVAVQIQGGMSAAKAFAGTDTRLWIDRDPVHAAYGRRGPRHLVRIRVGSDGRAPRWCIVPVTLHRPLPVDAQIKWVQLHLRRVGCSEEWECQFTLARARGWGPTDRATTGHVGIDIGWRLMDRGFRVACWSGSGGEEGDLVLPIEWLDAWMHVEGFRSSRDIAFNAVRRKLCEWLASHESILPEWLREATVTLSQWRSQARLAALVLRWRRERFKGDEDTWDGIADLDAMHPRDVNYHARAKLLADRGVIEAWRRVDRHLYEWETHEREKLQAQRRDAYRVFAAMLRRRYKTASIDARNQEPKAMDLRKFHELPGPDAAPTNGALREHVREACLSVLRQYLTESMAKIHMEPARETTMKCSRCGHVEDFDRASVDVTCRKCGVTEDQDYRAARNLRDAVASSLVPPRSVDQLADAS